MQMAAFCHHVPASYTFLTAPYQAEGEPDPGIAEFYSGYKYYEWYYKRKTRSVSDTETRENDIGRAMIHDEVQHDVGIFLGLESSIEQIIEFIRTYGPYDGILGFSQGKSLLLRPKLTLYMTNAAIMNR
jgi:hypothetical protein